MARINAGKYRHVVTFQRLRETHNSYGETSIHIDSNWEDVFTARVGIFPISGREALLDDVVKGVVSHRVVMRYRPNVDNKMRIKFGTRIFEITSPAINPSELGQELILMCKEKDIQTTGVL